MKPRFVICALVLAGLSAPNIAAAQTPAPAPVPPAPAAMPAHPGDLPCLLRMMQMTMLTKKTADDPKSDPAMREKASTLSAEGRRASYYYIGRLGPNWGDIYRAPEAQVAFKAMTALPNDQLAREMAVCMVAATDAEKKVLDAMLTKKN
jgi:hypothetical protein